MEVFLSSQSLNIGKRGIVFCVNKELPALPAVKPAAELVIAELILFSGARGLLT